MKEFWDAIEKKDCEKVLELLDDYLEQVEDEEELMRAAKTLEGLAIECRSYDLAHEIAHLYAHMGEEDIFRPYRGILEKSKGDIEAYAEALYHLAEAYEHFGFPEEAVRSYEELLKMEEDELERALTLAHMALAYEEMNELEKAIDFMEKAKGAFEKLKDETNYLVSLVDLAHFYYGAGMDEKAEEYIKEVLKSPRGTEIDVNALLVESEIYAGRGEYKRAFGNISKAMLQALEAEDENLFLFAFDTLLNFLDEMFAEKEFRGIYENVGILVEAFEDLNKDYGNFFKALGELARFKEGQEDAKGRFEEVYSSIEDEELREILDEFKEKGIKFLNVGL